MITDSTPTMRRRELLVCSAVFALPGCSNTPGDGTTSKTSSRSHSDESPTATAQPPEALIPTAPNGWTVTSEGKASLGEVADEVEGYETYYESPGGDEYEVTIALYSVESDDGNKAGISWKELGWELIVAKGRYLFAVSWGERGRPKTPTPDHPPLPIGTFTEGGDDAGVELLSRSPALTEEYIRENRYEALNPGTETDTTDG